jgi:hypothetical protein
MRRIALSVGLGMMAALVPASALAHHAEVDACLTRADVGICDDTFSYLYGDTVILKGTVSPLHDEAVVQRKAPGSDRWERVATVSVSDAGRAKWRWHTRRRDAVQDAPYLLRFKIPGHGRSDTVEAWVLLGE